MDKANLLTALIAGDLDYYTFGGSVSEENRPVAEKAGFTVQAGEVPSTFYELMINNESIASADLRHAIEKALDKQLLCQQNSGTLGTVTNSSILPDTPYSGPSDLTTYDPDQAKQLLDKAGYQGGDLHPGLHQCSGQPGGFDSAEPGGGGHSGGD